MSDIDTATRHQKMRDMLRAYAEKNGKAAACDLLAEVAGVTSASKVPPDKISKVIAACGAMRIPNRRTAEIYAAWNKRPVRSEP